MKLNKKLNTIILATAISMSSLSVVATEIIDNTAVITESVDNTTEVIEEKDNQTEFNVAQGSDKQTQGTFYPFNLARNIFDIDKYDEQHPYLYGYLLEDILDDVTDETKRKNAVCILDKTQREIYDFQGNVIIKDDEIYSPYTGKTLVDKDGVIYLDEKAIIDVDGNLQSNDLAMVEDIANSIIRIVDKDNPSTVYIEQDFSANAITTKLIDGNNEIKVEDYLQGQVELIFDDIKLIHLWDENEDVLLYAYNSSEVSDELFGYGYRNDTDGQLIDKILLIDSYTEVRDQETGITPTPTPTPIPVVTPSVKPSQTPVPTVVPSQSPSQTPAPTVAPSQGPSQTLAPTAVPSTSPSQTPVPTVAPSVSPTPTPTALTIQGMPGLEQCAPNVSTRPNQDANIINLITNTCVIDRQNNIYSANGNKIVDTYGNIYSPKSGRILIDNQGYILDEAGNRIISPDGSIDKRLVGIRQVGTFYDGTSIQVYNKDTMQKPYLLEPLNQKANTLRWFILDGIEPNVTRYEAVQKKNADGTVYSTSITLDGTTLTYYEDGVVTYTIEGNEIFNVDGTAFNLSNKNAYARGVDISTSSTSSNSSSSTAQPSKTENKSPSTEQTGQAVKDESSLANEQTKTEESAKAEAVAKVAQLQAQVSSNTAEVIKAMPVVTPKQKPVEKNTSITLNGKELKLENKVMVSNERTFLPIRTIAEALDIQVGFNAQSKVAILCKDEITIELPVNRGVAIVNGSEAVVIDNTNDKVGTFVQDGRTYLPVRFIAEQLGLKVNYEGNNISLNK